MRRRSPGPGRGHDRFSLPPRTAPRGRPRFSRLGDVIPTDPRRLVILTEGFFTIHDAKTALGVIRYGHDEILAILDSTMAGRNLREVMPPFDVPFVATLDEALEGPVRPNGLLIGIAPTGGRLPGDWRAIDPPGDRGPASTSIPGCISSWATTPNSRRPPPRPARRSIDYRRPPDRMETAVGRRHLPGKRVILTVGTDCAIGKMSVALELVAAARRDGASAVVRPDRPDRDDDRRLGRRRRPGHQRLHERHGRVAGRAGRGARGLGDRRGPGLDRPSRLQRR